MGKNSALFFICLAVISACASKPGSPYDRAVENYQMGHIDECVDAYREAIVADPSDLHAKFNLAVICQDRGKSDEAEALYRKIVEQDPGFAPAWSNLASIREKSGLSDEAEKLHRRAMEADRDGCAAASQFGYFLLRSQRGEEAAVIFKQSITKDPHCANAWFGLGEIAEAKGDLRAAVGNYDKALIYNPSDLGACLRSADIMISQGDGKRALELLRKAENLDPASGDIKLKLGILLREDGKLKDAEKALEGAKTAGAPQAECDRELSIVYGRLSEEAAGKAAPVQSF